MLCLWFHLLWGEQHCIPPPHSRPGGFPSPDHDGPGSSPWLLLAAAASIVSTSIALSCIAGLSARSSPMRRPTYWLLARATTPAVPVCALLAVRDSPAPAHCLSTICCHCLPSRDLSLSTSSWALRCSQSLPRFHRCSSNLILLSLHCSVPIAHLPIASTLSQWTCCRAV